jgi:hypothetical protein
MIISLPILLIGVPTLAVTALVLWLKDSRSGVPFWRNSIGVCSVVIFVDWAWFLFLAYRGQIGGFGTHYLTTRSADVFLLISFTALVAAFALKGAPRGFAISQHSSWSPFGSVVKWSLEL